MEKGISDIDRALLLETVEETVAIHDALRSLPSTTWYLFVFVGMVSGRLRIFERQMVERPLAAWTSGRNPLTEFSNTDNIGVFWNWLDSERLANRMICYKNLLVRF